MPAAKKSAPKAASKSDPGPVSKADPNPAAPASTRSTMVIVAAVGAVIGLVLGFQIARWTAPAPDVASPAGAEVPPHSHTNEGAPGAELGGLSLSAGGYTLVPEQTQFTAGAAAGLRFRVTGPDGKPVTSYVTTQEKPLHLVVVRRDLTGYRHLHPALAPDGWWSIPLTLPTPGVWRAYADFTVVGSNGAQVSLALGTDLTVAGAYTPEALPAASRESTVDGYLVTYEGTPRPLATAPLTFRAYRNGQLVSLEPYLGALGHLVVLREGDLGYVHVHSDPPTGTPTQARFWLSAPSSGRYRMFFEFQQGLAVHTAAFTVTLGGQ